MNIIEKISWRSPSNIALVKYWGKHSEQLPCNASLSFSLNNCYTTTSIAIAKKENSKPISFDFIFENKQNDNFSKRIEKYLQRLSEELSFIKEYHLHIESENSFPHSAGIASSASAMSALALCLLSLHYKLNGNEHKTEAFFRQASNYARIGSGSAARSVFGNYNVWGKHNKVNESCDAYSIPIQDNIDSKFLSIYDSVLLIDSGLKEKSSSAGHTLMNGHPFAESRFLQANQNLTALLETLKSGNFNAFSNIVENEALSLHAMMMTSSPWYMLLSANSISAINAIKKFRLNSGVEICFTIDAGPNIHILYTEKYKIQVQNFIEEKLKVLCTEGKVIHDKIGDGPICL